jgi:hypothetical protein
LSLYFLFDMSCISSHLRTNYINFSCIFLRETRQHSLQAKHSKCTGRDVDCSHYQNRAGSDRFGPVPFRQTFSLGDGTELRLDGDVPVSVNLSV